MSIRAAGILAILALATASACGDGGDAHSALAAAAVAPVAQARSSDSPTTAHGRMRGPTAPHHESRRPRAPSAAVYVDGSPVGVLAPGELPRSLAPVPGDGDDSARRYRLADYLARVGVGLRQIRELHLHGTDGRVARIRGSQLRRFKETLTFGFADGKALAELPPALAVDTDVDRIAGVTVYADDKPPVIDDQHRAQLDASPAAGKPLDGGIRIYRNDRLVGVIARDALDPAADYAVERRGDVWYRLFPVLELLAIETGDIVDAQAVIDQHRANIISGAVLRRTSFRAAAGDRGTILLDDARRTELEALTLYSDKLAPLPLEPQNRPAPSR